MKYDAAGIVTLAGWSLAFLAFLAFTVSYGVLARAYWWRSAAGRWLMALASIVVVTLALSLTRVALGDYPGRRWLLAAAAGLFAAVGAWLDIELYRARKKGSDNGNIQ